MDEQYKKRIKFTNYIFFLLEMFLMIILSSERTNLGLIDEDEEECLKKNSSDSSK